MGGHRHRAARLALVLPLAVALGAGMLGSACGRDPSSAEAAVRQSFMLVSLPSLGTASWRCGRQDGTYGLSFRVFPSTATTDLRLVVGGRVVRRTTVNPGEVHRFPILGRSQRLELTQGTGAGILRATAAVRFDEAPVVSHCFAYSPPHLAVRVRPRR
jgi:hypothetical protein